MATSGDRMAHVARFLIAVVGICLLACGAHASPIDGLWLVQEKDAHVRIGLFRGAHNGRIVWVRDSLDTQGRLRHDTKNPDAALRGRLMRDLVMVSDLAPTSADSTQWKARVYDPRNGHTYAAHLTLEGPDRLKLRGYVGISLFGRTAHWTRVAEPASQDSKPGPAPALHTTTH